MLALIEAGYREEEVWRLTFSQLQRRLKARRRLLTVRRLEHMQDTRIGVNGDTDAVKSYIASLDLK